MKTTIAFIGGGNMARSLLGGLIADGSDPQSLWVADPDAGQREGLRAQLGIQTSADNLSVAEQADVLVLAVKPQALRSVATELAPVVQRRRPLVVSVAAGIREPDVNRWLGGNTALVRCMPNTPALVGSGATGLYANAQVSTGQREQAETLLRAVGLTIWVAEERLLDSVTALSGSGPAYFFLVMEAMEQAGIELGLTPEQSRLLTLQTAFGAAKMALESSDGPAVLRARVTSKGGTTEQAIKTLRDHGLEALFAQAMKAAHDRARELGDLLGGDA